MNKITPQTAKEWLDKGEAVLVDVRELSEHRSLSIPDTQCQPLGSVCCANLPAQEKKIIIHCQKGGRGESACTKLLAENPALQIYNMEGGIAAWQAAGFPVTSTGKKILPLDRQVQLTIGLCVLLFSVLALIANPLYAVGAAFFGAGLAFAGLSGFCGLARLMARMPWNRAT